MTDESKLLALPEALNAAISRYSICCDITTRKELDAAIQAYALAHRHEAASLEADARRYRWAVDYDGEGSLAEQEAWAAFCGPYTKEYIDTKIDAALATENDDEG